MNTVNKDIFTCEIYFKIKYCISAYNILFGMQNISLIQCI